MPKITIKTGQVLKRIQKIKDGLSFGRTILEDVEKEVLQDIEKQFDTEGAHITKKWEGLKKGTVRGRLRAGYGSGPILQRTGKLKGSVKRKSLSNTKLVLTNTANYYKYHQLGGAKIPKRQMLAVNRKMANRYVKIVLKHLKKLVHE